MSTSITIHVSKKPARVEVSKVIQNMSCESCLLMKVETSYLSEVMIRLLCSGREWELHHLRNLRELLLFQIVKWQESLNVLKKMMKVHESLHVRIRYLKKVKKSQVWMSPRKLVEMSQERQAKMNQA